MTTSVESAAREHEILEYSGRKWVTIETAAAYATSERSRVIAELIEKAEDAANSGPDWGMHWIDVADWLRSQEVK